MRRLTVIACLFLPLLGLVFQSAAAAQDLDCGDLAWDEAQQVLAQDPSDPHGLDGDSDGEACESSPRSGSQPVVNAPAANESSQASGSSNAEANTVPALGTTLQSGDCAAYDAWEWAQLVLESNPQLAGALDPDGNGNACEELPRGGFAPAIWTDTIPEDAQQGQVIRLVDGDTIEVAVEGVSRTYRIYRADTPETQNELHCGGPEATSFAEYALSFNDNPGVVYLERDVNERDQYGRYLAYVWFEIAGESYMLNHVLIHTGWAEDVDYGDRKYDAQFKTSAAMAEEHQLGVYGLCGAFEIPATQPTPTPVPVVEQPAAPPAQEQEPASSGCDPNYTPCVPIVSHDLNCDDIGHSVTIIGGDPHGFDGNDNDGYGCESW